MRHAILTGFLIGITAAPVVAQGQTETRSKTATQGRRNYAAPTPGDFVIRDFHFQSGEVLPELKLHYRTLGTPVREKGVTRNAVLVLHGTGGSGQNFLTEQFAGVLFGPGQLLDAERYFIILPDGIGHGQSSKPSDGLHARFPHYTYADMIAAQHRLITEKLGVNHLRLVMGTSMGGMHSWVWGETYPDFMDALMPLASLPVEIAGRNRMMRRMILDAIRTDPDWNNGEYKTQPRGLITAVDMLLIMGSAPLYWQKLAPTREQADKFLEQRTKAALARMDANDFLYQVDSSREYNPAPKLDRIQAPLLAINSADDTINPPELGILEREIKHVKNGRCVVLPITDATRGHGTHSLPAIWQNYLAELLEASKPRGESR
jgi:homoserine O-acetyltransferase